MDFSANDQDRSRHGSELPISAESNQTFGLESGRSLGYAEWGDASGFPLVQFHGSSSSRLEHPVQQEVLEGVRLLTIDRPGHGLSEFQPDRTLLDWPHDVAALADHLGIERFAVSGWSAGGPYAFGVCVPDSGAAHCGGIGLQLWTLRPTGGDGGHGPFQQGGRAACPGR